MSQEQVDGYALRLVAGAWQGGEAVDGRWVGMTGRGSKAYARKALRASIEKLGLGDVPPRSFPEFKESSCL